MTSYKASQFSLTSDTNEIRGPEEEDEDDSEEEPEEDPEEDPEEEDEETDPEEESGDEPDEELPQGPLKLSGVGSKERKRPLDATESDSDRFKSQKFRHDQACKMESNGKSENGESADKQLENTGSSRKQRRSRWDQQVEQDAKISEADKTIRRRKSRWGSDTPQLETLSEVEKLKQELLDIKVKLLMSELEDDRPEGERSPSPPPEYNNLGQRTNTRQLRLQRKLLNRQKDIASKLAEKLLTFELPPVNKPPKLFKKIYIPVKEFPTYNFIGLIIGPRGNTLKKMEQETGAKILLRGKGSTKALDTSDDEDLHVIVEAKNQNSLYSAVAMVEKLLVPVDDNANHHKKVQLEELAKLNGTYNICRVCKEQGHMNYACPNQKSTFDAVMACTTCGSSGHLASMCIPSGSVPKTHEISDRSLYVGFLPQAVDENRLRELFSPFGKIVDVKVIKDRNTGVSKGYGFVNFEASSDAAMAVAHMNGHPMEGKMLAVRVAGRPQQVQQKPPGLPPVMAYLPNYPGFAAISADTQRQIARPGPPGSAPPPAVQAFFPRTEGLGHSNHLPGGTAMSVLPGFAAISAETQSQTAWPGQPGSAPPQVQAFFPKTEGLGHSNHLPGGTAMSVLPGFAAISAETQNQTAWPGSAPPQVQTFYPKTEGLGHSNHLPGGNATSVLPPVVSGHPSSRYGSSFDSHYRYPIQIPHSPPKPAQFPGDLDYPGSQFPGDPDYPGSLMSPFFGASTTKPSMFDFSQTPDNARHSSWRSS